MHLFVWLYMKGGHLLPRTPMHNLGLGTKWCYCTPPPYLTVCCLLHILNRLPEAPKSAFRLRICQPALNSLSKSVEHNARKDRKDPV